jgi:PAS domain S-box-containing protein
MGKTAFQPARERQRPALKIAVIYAGLGASWIFFSDKMALMISSSPEVLTQIAIIKGWLYVLLTSLLLYKLVSRSMKELELSQEAHLRAKEDWERTFDTVPDLIAILDNDYRIVRANRAMAAKLGLKPEECSGLTCYQAVHGASHPPSFCPHTQLLTNGIEHTTEVHEDRLGGDFIVSVSPLLDSTGELIGSVHVARDITDRKQAEETLCIANHFLESIIEHATEGLCVCHDIPVYPFVKFTVWNQRMQEITGYSMEEINRLGWYQTVYPDSKVQTRAKERMARMRAGEDLHDEEWEITRSDGRTRILQITTTILQCLHGQAHVLALMQDITDRKRAEEALAESEKRYRLISETIEDAFWMATPGIEQMIYVSPAYKKIWGRTQESLYESPKSFIDAIHPEDRSRVLDVMNMSRSQGRSWSVTYRVVRPDGSISWVEDRGFPVQDDQGKLYLNIGVARDVTKHKQAEEALSNSQERLNLALRSSRAGTWDRDIAADKATWDDHVHTLFGLPPRSFSGKLEDFLGMLHPDDRERVRGEMTTAIDGFADYSTTYRVIRPDSSEHYLAARGKVFRDNAGQAVHMIGVCWDISELKRSEEALRESEEKFRLAFDNANTAMYLVDLQGRLLQVNDKMSAIFGYSKSEMEGMSINDLALPEDSALSPKFIHEAIQGAGDSATFEERYYHQQGHIIYGQVASSLVRDAQGQPRYFISQVQDITERKRVEREKEKLEIQLRQAQKLEAIGTLAGGIAHDINNILGIITGNAELAQLVMPGETKANRNIDEVLKACARGKDLVQQILTFSRMEVKLDRQPADVGLTIRETLRFLRATLPATIEVRQNIPEKNLIALANTTQITQLLTNLCTNAAHAMEETGGILEVSLKEVNFDADAVLLDTNLKPGRYISLSVSDTGHGMDSWTLERIFDPYFTTKEVGKGSGLGLSVVQGIVKKHEGAITIRSEPGMGATFDIYLPGIESEATREDRPDEPLLKGTERILFIDDEPSLADIGQTGLSLLGYEVTGKTSSVEALELFEAQPDRFDLVITDYTMPEMTGADLAKEIMKIRPEIPVILCTGFNERITEGKALEMGIRGFAMKPFTIRSLAETVRRILDKEQN